MACIAIERDGAIVARTERDGAVNLLFRQAYRPGDEIVFTADGTRARIKADACVETARMFLAKRSFRFRVPLQGDAPAVYPPGAFAGNLHLLSIEPDESNEKRNLACNPLDQHADSGAYPHASANVETRGESVFFARNVIDGITAAAGHGEWPYQSWGIGAREDAELTLDFGREVEIDTAILFLRADFPHDAYWTQATLTLSDGTARTFSLEQKNGPQAIALGRHTVRRIRLQDLHKSDDPSAFPALRQLMVFGRDPA